MADRLDIESTLPPQNPNPNPNNFSSELDSIPIPPFDSLFFSPNGNNNNGMSTDSFISDLGLDLGFDENAGFELTFDDLDDLYLPSDADDFLLSDPFQPLVQPEEFNSDSTKITESPNSGSSGVSVDRGSDAATFVNFPSSDSGSYNREYSPPVSSENSGDQNSGGSVSSQGSGNRPNSPDSSNVVIVDQKIKSEETGLKNSVSKRKKDQGCGGGDNENASELSRRTKYHRRSSSEKNAANSSMQNSQFGFDAANNSTDNSNDDDDEKRKARLMRNRESAQLSRQRKKHYVEELEDKVRAMHSTISELNSKISYIMAENATLRQQLSGGGGSGAAMPHPSGMYPHPAMAPMGYPWMPCAPYVVKPQGSQVPLVPIPRLKTKQPVTAPKGKRSDSKKSEVKTKKVASVSFLGLLFFVVLFGGLVPIMNVRNGGIGDSVSSGSGYVSDRFYDQRNGKVLNVNGYSNGSEESMGVGFSRGNFDLSNRVNYEKGYSDNASEPLVASLYVPRNDKLVKIDGNLVIHSVLASEKAMASQVDTGKKDNRETGLAIPRDLAPALAIPGGRHSQLYRNPTGEQKALTSGSADPLKDNLKSSAADGKLQQWFREGLAGPLLSSGMCTEVFHFDVSPASATGAIVPASSVSNVSTEHRRNATRLNKGRNRRILRGIPLPPVGSNLNVTEDHMGRNPQKDNFNGNKSVSSMVVSVLVDPREVGDSDVDGMITPKSLSRIFVVVLLDSVKYVTYSCVLPRSGPHLVTT